MVRTLLLEFSYSHALEGTCWINAELRRCCAYESTTPSEDKSLRGART